MAKWLLKAKHRGVITLDNVDCKEGDIFIVETLGDNWPTAQDVAKSVGKNWSGSYGSIPHRGGRTSAGEKFESNAWELTRL